MKGSDKWGQGGGPKIRVELILAALIAVSAVLGYYYYAESNQLTTVGQFGAVTSISTTGISCNDSSMPPTAQAVENDTRFASLSDGLCYNYVGESASGASTVLTFDYYNGTIAYACGTLAQEMVSRQIEAAVSNSTGNISSIQVTNSTNLNAPVTCPATPSPVIVVSVEDAESTIPAVPQLNLTLASSPGEEPITSLKASLTLDGGSQQFQLVAPPATLTSGKAVSKVEIVLSGVSFTSNETYPMTISGTFKDGGTFSYQAFVEIAQVP